MNAVVHPQCLKEVLGRLERVHHVVYGKIKRVAYEKAGKESKGQIAHHYPEHQQKYSRQRYAQ